MIYRISSRSNEKVRSLVKDKSKDRYLVFEGEKLAADILNRGVPVSILVIDEKMENDFIIPSQARVGDTWYVSDTVIDKISSLSEKPAVIAVLQWQGGLIDFASVKAAICLDNIQDPANAGTVSRCAAAFGIDSIAFTGESVNIANPKFLRAAQDSFFNLKYRRFKDVEELLQEVKEKNPSIHIYLTSSHSTPHVVSPTQIQFPCLVVFGNEGKGLKQSLFESYPSVMIPQTEMVESLNVGVSACIVMYEIFSRRVS